MSLKPLGNPVSRESRGVGAIFIQMLLLFLKKLFKRGGGGINWSPVLKLPSAWHHPHLLACPPQGLLRGAVGTTEHRIAFHSVAIPWLRLPAQAPSGLR